MGVAFPLSHVGRMLPMGRILRVEPFCFARKVVSPMDSYSLLSFLGRITDGLGEQENGTTAHCRCRKPSASTLLTLSVQYKYCTDN